MSKSDKQQLSDWLQEVKDGACSIEDGVHRLQGLLGTQARSGMLDFDRAERRGFPEVISGQGKTAEQVAQIFDSLAAVHKIVLCTRATPEHVEATRKKVPHCKYDPVARALYLEPEVIEDRGRGTILVVSAGTADLPVAREAELTARLMGNQVEFLFDVGIAGLHRILSCMEQVKKAEILIVIAGMEGALPSVLAGLCDRPMIAVPTSVGYGTGADGSAALNSMLNSCVAGITVVNIDNGFGAGYAAALINRKRSESEKEV